MDDLQHIVQQLAGGAHKGNALFILPLARALAHQQDLRVPGTVPKDHVLPLFTKGAAIAAKTFGLQCFP